MEWLEPRPQRCQELGKLHKLTFKKLDVSLFNKSSNSMNAFANMFFGHLSEWPYHDNWRHFFFHQINSKKETSGSQKKTQEKGPKTGSVKKEKAVKPEEGNEPF